jgi:CRP/FNR family transcriptional regulator, anaerobic regulatory protein
MTQTLIRQTNSDVASEVTSCSTCLLCDLNLCADAKIGQKGGTRRNDFTTPLKSIKQTTPARRPILHLNEWTEFVTIVCEGWASSSVVLPDGRRQILSFVLPGDVAPMVSLFEATSGHLTESITRTTHRNFKRDELQTVFFEDRRAMDRLKKVWTEDRLQIEKKALALGRQTAEERIARLILNKLDRLGKRGMTDGRTMEFPLRQHHIADAVGLTPVHVSRIMSEFRRNDLIEISDRSLTVLDLPGLRHTASF